MSEATNTENKKTFHCEKCGYEWEQKFPGLTPKNCANKKCKSPSWWIPKGERKSYTWKSEETKARARRKPKAGLGY